MKEQKFIITDSQYDVQNLIDKGWLVVSVTAQHIATGSSFQVTGKFAVLLERGVTNA
jgi:hypothetical protein